MKKWFVLVLVLLNILGIKELAYAITVGNPMDIDVPMKSAVLREEIINKTLSEYEQRDQIVKIKISLDMELIFSKRLNVRRDLDNAELEGRYQMVKIGVTLFNRIEPYIKLGTSRLEVKWNQHRQDNIVVGADYGFAWGGGLKAVLWDKGFRLTLDTQYRTTESDIEEFSIGSRSVREIGGDFKIEEYQASLVLSKKFEIPLKWQNIYIIPYTGITVSDSNVDVNATDPANTAVDYSLFDANSDEIWGFLFGCDIMPSLKSSFVYSLEARIINEYALSLGGAMKF